jgi:dTDP-4-amino-4,6-dideoxygalactose transaminase
MKYRIPFNKPFIAGKELYYVAQSVLGGHTSGDGPFMKKCEAFFQERFGVGRALLTTSCTSALEMAGLLCELKGGDEVILPSFTFVSTANAFVTRGIKPVFVDIRPDTKNLDETRVEEAITASTRAIVPVHYAGVSCEMDAIMAIARKNDLYVIEDAAQGVNSRYKGRFLGTIGDLGSFSFHETKNFICGEGGALLANNPRFVERAEIIREKGTNRAKFFRGQVDKYTWVDVGSSYIPSDLLAAFLFGQLEHMERITEKRKAIFGLYEALLAPLAGEGLIELPVVPDDCQSNYHMFYILLEDEKTRAALIEHLKKEGILAVFHYVPLHSSPMGRSLGGDAKPLPVTDGVSERLLRLPFYFELDEMEVRVVSDAIGAFFGRPKRD